MKTSIRIMFTHQIECQGSDHNMVKEFACFKSFYNFHYIIMATLCQKISVTKFQKSKIWDDCYEGISAGFIPVYSIFPLDIFSWKISQNSFEKSKNSHYLAANLHPPPREPSHFFLWVHFHHPTKRIVLKPSTLIEDPGLVL